MISLDTVELTIDDGVAKLTLARPEVGNAIDVALAVDLLAAVEACVDERVRVVLLTGAGHSFCVGGDVKGFAAEDDLPGLLRAITTSLHAAIECLVTLTVPVIAAVQGSAAGAGLSLALAADLVVAASSARFVPAHTAVGLTPDAGVSWLLPRVVGLQRSLDLALTNRVLAAAEAMEWGIVARVVPDDALATEAHDLAVRLANGPTWALGQAKRLLRDPQPSIATRLSDEARTLSDVARGYDGLEGVHAFVAKRRPAFRGR